MRKWFLLIIPVLLFARSVSAGTDDSVTVAASLQYGHPNLLQRVFIGSNYRKIWSLPVRMKVFNIRTEKGGFSHLKLGGGLQTKSLHMEDPEGRKWSLRTVDKDVVKAMEKEGIKSPFIRNVAQNSISAAHPYGALTVSPMAKAIGVVSAGPELVYVPDDPELGKYRSVFAHKVCLLERREPLIHPSDGTKSTEELREQLMRKEPLYLDEPQLLQARLLDMLIADWDRHDDQWQWGFQKGKETRLFYPIPRDHDQAYFTATGLLVRLVRPFAMKHLVGFRKKNVRLKQLNRKEWKFDRLFLKDLSEAEWQQGILRFQSLLTDQVLESAVRGLPAEVYQVQGKAIYDKLRRRRDSMLKNGMKYYHFLVRHIPIPAPDDKWGKEKKKKE